MSDPFVFAPPFWLDSTPSTNTHLKARVAKNLAASGETIATLRQTEGRGRMGNEWLSASSGDIAFSFFWQGEAAHAAAGALPMACAVGIQDYLTTLGIPALCKWPNDVLADGAKICGILTESTLAPGAPLSLIVGIGVNVRRSPERDRALGKKTAALEDFVVDPSPPEYLLPALLKCLEPRIVEWEAQGAAAVVPAMRERLWGVGKTVRARTPGGVVEGVVTGIGDDAELLLETAAGKCAVSSVSALETGWEC